MGARNAARTIRKAVVSTLRALPQNSELLVLLDDCSDDSFTVISDIKDLRLKIFQTQTRLGINAGRNFLLEKSGGAQIAIMDADDVCLPWRFSLSQPLLDDYEAVFGTAIIFGAKLRPLPILPQYPIELSGLSMLLALGVSNPLVHSTALMRRETIQSLGGYSDSLSEDYDLWLRMVASGARLKRVRMPLIAYRFHDLQASQAPEFMIKVRESTTLNDSLERARSVGKARLGSPGLFDLEEFRHALYENKPYMRLEHKGLPDWAKGRKSSF
jgi:hypothetical protein